MRKAAAEPLIERSGTILFVSCYELGHQPLAVASPRGFLQKRGYRSEVIDLAVESLDVERVSGAWFVAISVPMHTALRLGVRAAERVRQINPSCHICFYGLYASLNAEHLLEEVADSVIGGEFEESLVDLIEALAEARSERNGIDGRVSLQSVAANLDGVSTRGRIVGPVLKRLTFATPDRSGLSPLDRYAHLEYDGGHRLVGYVEASRGCLHRCLHCPIPPVYGGRFFIVPEAIVLADIRRLVRAGATHITFGDPDFLNGPGHALRVIRAMHNEFPDLTFDFTAKIEHLLKHQAVLSELAELGCLFIVSAVESLSDLVLTNLEKGHTREDVYAALEIVHGVGIALRPTWIPFTPWATLDDYIDTLEFIRSQGLIDHVDPVQYTIRLLIPPGSSLLGQPAIKPFLGPLDGSSFSYRWAHPDPQMDQLHREVSGLVEKAARKSEDPLITFNHIRQRAYAVRGDELLAPIVPGSLIRMGKAPRLTEPWFC